MANKEIAIKDNLREKLITAFNNEADYNYSEGSRVEVESNKAAKVLKEKFAFLKELEGKELEEATEKINQFSGLAYLAQALLTAIAEALALREAKTIDNLVQNYQLEEVNSLAEAILAAVEKIVAEQLAASGEGDTEIVNS